MRSSNRHARGPDAVNLPAMSPPRFPPLLRRLLALVVLAACTVPGTRAQSAEAGRRPNFVVFLTDDQGYGDLSSYGHPTISTPVIDRMAREGIRLTSFYAAPVCTPSRAQFLTGRYAFRSGLINAIGPAAPRGLEAAETTLAEALKAQGYRTALFGKWHLGDFATTPAFNPRAHGFDAFLGLPYSHDYRVPFVQNAPTVPLYRGFDEIERPVVAATLTQRLTQEAVAFIRDAGTEPFFLFVAYVMPHLPIELPAEAVGRSRAGRYGDAIEEIDASVGAVLAALKAQGVDGSTVTVYFSDNGPWTNAQARSYQEGQTLWDTGSAGPLRGSKATTWEAGLRVPGVIRWPDRIQPGRVSADPVSAMDLYPTFVRLAGGRAPAARPLDGLDLSEFLLEGARSPRRELFYVLGSDLQAVRVDEWKLRLNPAPGASPSDAVPAELFDLERDPGERLDVASEHPDVVARLRARLANFRREMPSLNRAPAAAGGP